MGIVMMLREGDVVVVRSICTNRIGLDYTLPYVHVMTSADLRGMDLVYQHHGKGI